MTLTPPLTRRPSLVLEPSKPWSLPNLAEVWEFRDLLLSLARRDITLRYRQTFLGIGWVLLQPLLAAGVFAFVFSRVAGMTSDSPYFVFTFTGLLAWNLFAGTLTRSSGSLVQNSQLVSKVYFPRLVLPMSTVCSALIDFAVGSLVLVILLAIYRIHVGPQLLLAPVCLIGLILLALGGGLWAAALSVTYRDVQYILPFLTQMLLYASPLAYQADRVPQRYRSFYELNPLAGLLEGFHWSVIGNGHVHWGAFGYAMAFSVVLFGCGAMAFKRMERRFADVI